MSLAVRGEPVRHFPGAPREVFDVSGAGDTALAALGLALAAGRGSLEAAVEFALLASGVVVGKAGTAVVTPGRADRGRDGRPRRPGRGQDRHPGARWPTRSRAGGAQGLKVGFTNGCFDILHRGHVAYLAQARAWCDRLIVALNTDASVRALKGEGRPVNDLDSRALVLGGPGARRPGGAVRRRRRRWP